MHENKGKTILALPKAQYLNPLPLTCPMHLNHSVKLGLLWLFFCYMRQKMRLIDHTTMIPEIKAALATLSKNLFEKIQLLAILASAFNCTGMWCHHHGNPSTPVTLLTTTPSIKSTAILILRPICINRNLYVISLMVRLSENLLKLSL